MRMQMRNRIIITFGLLMGFVSLAAGQEALRNYYKMRFHCEGFDQASCIRMAGIDRSGRIMRNKIPSIIPNVIDEIRRNGYPLAEPDSVVYKQNPARIVNVYINTGPELQGSQYRIISGMDIIDSTDNPGLITEAAILDEVESLLTNWIDSGFPFVQVEIKPVDVTLANDSLSACIDYIVRPGRFYRIGKVEFPGKKWSQQKYLRLESRLKRGDIFSGKRLDRAVERLQKLEFMSRVGNPAIKRESPGVVTVQIPIEEQRINRISGVAALQPESNQAAGEIDVQFGNLFGSGRKLSFAWRWLNPDRRGIEVSYREPWLFNKPLYGETGFTQWSEDTLGTVTNLNLKLGWEPTTHIQLEAITGHERFDSDSVYYSERATRTLWGGLGLTLDYLDQHWNPIEGYNLVVESALGLSRNRITGNYRQRISRDKLAFTSVYALAKKWIALGRITGTDVSGYEVGLDELARISGTGAVRGYPEERSLGRGVVWSSAEIRWRPDSNSFLGLFVDGGYVYRKDTRLSGIDKGLLSFGLTSGFTVPMGIFSIDIGLAHNEPINRARLHFRLINRF